MRGLPGNTGRTGVTGQRGRAGDTGDTGPIGATGFTGDQGRLSTCNINFSKYTFFYYNLVHMIMWMDAKSLVMFKVMSNSANNKMQNKMNTPYTTKMRKKEEIADKSIHYSESSTLA